MTDTAAPKRSPVHAAPSRLLSDGRLAQRATRGDRRAFEAIYQRYHQELYRFCLAMVGNAQAGETREIKLKPWLYRIARNEAIETVRKRRDNAELEPERASSTLEIAQTAEARERLRRLMSDLEELPERQRGALVMRELAGLGFEQIGAAFQTSAAVARQTVYEARLSLRQMEEGREMSCDAVTRELSDADGRVARRREIRAHLRSCASCRAFRDSIETRHTDLAAIAPLPIAVSLGLLHGVLAGQASAAVGGTAAAAGTAAGTAGAGAAGGGVAGTVGAGAGKVIATSAIAKSVATVAVVAAVGVTAADRSHLIDVPLLGGSGSAKSTSQPTTSPQGHGNGPANLQGPAAGSGTGAGQGKSGDGGRRARGAARNRSASRRRGSKRAHARRHGKQRGHGRSRAKHHGRPAELPAASHHGQQTAAAHKSPRANPSPASSPPPKTKSGGDPSSSSPPPASSPPPKEKTVEETSPEPTPPPSESPGQGKGGASPQGGGEGTP
jgi:DNA-directed RNA polymerase specialized sigma24 family protein